MKLIVYCKQCDKSHDVKSKKSDRYELRDEIGKEINLKCDKCDKENKFHIDEVRAEVSMGQILLPIIIIMTGVLVLSMIFKMGYVTFLPIGALFVGLMIYQSQESRKIRDFNRIKIDGRSY